MRTRTIALVAALAALLLGAWLAVRPSGTPTGGAGRRASVFAVDEVPVERVDRVRIAYADGRAFEFGRDARGWAQSAPFPHPAEPASVREAIDVAASLVASRTVRPDGLPPDARAALGLEPPAATVELSWPGGSRTVALGKRSVSGRAWVQVAGRPEASSVDADLHALVLDSDARQWRSLRLHEPGDADVGEVEIRFGAAPGQRVLLRRSGGRWRMLEPVATRADGDSVRNYLEALERAEADAFAADRPEEPAAFGLAAAERGVRLRRAGAPESEPAVTDIEVGAPAAEGAEERFARVGGRPTVVQLGKRALAALFPPPAFFIDPRGCDVVPADVRAAEFVPFAAAGSPPRTGFALRRERDGWRLEVPGAGALPADTDRCRRLLAQLCEARAPAVALQPMPEELRLGEFVLAGEGGAELARVRVAREPGAQWALDAGEGVLRVFPAGFDLSVEAGAYAGRR